MTGRSRRAQRQQAPEATGCLPTDAFPACQMLLATSLSARMRGLLFAPGSEDIMVLMPCHDIHTFGMSFAIDVAFLDREGRVRKVARDVLPNKRLRDAGAAAVLERRAIPRSIWFEEGDHLTLGRFRQSMLVPMQAEAGDEAAPATPNVATTSRQETGKIAVPSTTAPEEEDNR